ncbi:MAG: zinc ribbon domain-containing protein [Deltaproteobacteria bacterium]|nr:zinc ribbon domain-containing protein [Deltaproteobacteria bacterium]
MPIYEFKCKKCNNTFEFLCIKSDDKDHLVCPHCGHKEVETLFSTFSSKGSMSFSSCSPSGGFS